MNNDRLVTHQDGYNKGKYVLYWMQQAQRVAYNAALTQAIRLANDANLPLVVLFILSDQVPDANERHYYFMMQGLYETAKQVNELGADFCFSCGDPVERVTQYASHALAVVADSGYLHYQRQWRTELGRRLALLGCAYWEWETEPLIPVTLASNKEEYSAATLRRKLLKLLPAVSLTDTVPACRIAQLSNEHFANGVYRVGTESFTSLWKWVSSQARFDATVSPITTVYGGVSEARKLLAEFIQHKLDVYDAQRSNPAVDMASGLSPYLHFGQISAMEIVQQAMQHYRAGIEELCLWLGDRKDLQPHPANLASFTEELIVRRELSFNFCHYNAQYDSFSCLPDWAKRTLQEHERDKREEQYSLDRMEQCATNDIYWNAAQREMMASGRMHNYMRMYWGKRVIAWCQAPEEAYRILLYLNNKYELDGRDPNAFAGVAWCFGKHDRPWQTREIYGMVRYMNASGLTRKFDMAAYLSRIQPPKGL